MLKTISLSINQPSIVKVVILTCLLVLQFSSSRAQDNHSFSESYKVSEPAQLAISSSDGNIEILPSEQSSIVVHYIVRRNGKLIEMSRAELQKEVTLTITPTANSLKISVKYPNNSGFFDSMNKVTVSFKIYAPKQTACDLRTSDGNVKISGLVSNQLIQTSDGNIDVAGIKGSVKGGTSDGHIIAKDIAGQVNLNTSDGNINLVNIDGNVSSGTSDGNLQATKVKGDLSLRTSDGHIEFSAIAGSLTAVTSEGNITGSIVELHKKLSLVTSDGNISVTIPGGLGLNLDLRGTSIETSLKNFSGTSKKELIQGKINGGGIPVALKVSDGRVVLNYR